MIQIKYCSYSNTIRQFPQNYMLAYNNGKVWLMEPDLNSDRGLVVALTLALMDFEMKYSKDSLSIILETCQNFDGDIEILP